MAIKENVITSFAKIKSVTIEVNRAKRPGVEKSLAEVVENIVRNSVEITNATINLNVPLSR